MSFLLGLGLIILFGLAFSKILGKTSLPAVTTFLLVGILVGPYALNIVPGALLSNQQIIADGVLAFIAFMIGGNFTAKYLKRLMGQVLWISIMEALGAWVLVSGIFLLFGFPFSTSIIYGSIASATAPAATVAVIRQYRSRGPLTETLIGVVALDDVWCLVLSALSLSIAMSLHNHSSNTSVALLKAASIIFLSILLGSVLAYLFHQIANRVRSNEELTAWVLGIILLTAGLTSLFHLSVLLAAMAMGAILSNISPESRKYFNSAETVTFVLYEIFFILAGSALEINLLPGVGLMGLAYIVARIIGKVSGAALGSWASNAPRNVRRYLGFGLIPQAGVALGVAMSVQAKMPTVGNAVLTLVIATTVVHELIGPPLTRMVLTRAGEVSLPKIQSGEKSHAEGAARGSKIS